MSTAICIASGPSLTQRDVNLCRNKGDIIAINDCYKLAPWADILYACDEPWWTEHKGVPSFKGAKYSWSVDACKKYDINHVEFDVTGGNSGFQALSLAMQRGSTRVILLGYDMKLAECGKSHWFGHHPQRLSQSSNYKQWIENFAEYAPIFKGKGVQIINATRDTALHCFEKMPLEEALAL